MTEEYRASSIGGRSVFQENGSGAPPWLRWRCVPSPHPAGTTHPVNSLRESLLPAWQHRFHWKWGRAVRFQETQKNRGHKFYASSFHTKLLFLANEGASRKIFVPEEWQGFDSRVDAQAFGLGVSTLGPDKEKGSTPKGVPIPS